MNLIFIEELKIGKGLTKILKFKMEYILSWRHSYLTNRNETKSNLIKITYQNLIHSNLLFVQEHTLQMGRF
jgi:hypothetical protein